VRPRVDMWTWMGVGPGVEAAVDGLLSDACDLFLIEVSDERRGRPWAPRTGLGPRRALEAVSAQQLEQPALAGPWTPASVLMDRPVRGVSIRNRPCPREALSSKDPPIS
jgi:hypothetical protein